MKNVDHKSSATEAVKAFYDDFGWKSDGKSSGEDRLFRAFPRAHSPYGEAVEQRTLRVLKGRCGSLLFVGCGDMPESHVELSTQFAAVHCVDISETALSIARDKIGERGKYYCDSIVESELPDNLVDAAFCAHVIYHIHKDQQEQAVRQILRLTKPGGRVLVIYANPRTVFTLPGEVLRRSRRILRSRRSGRETVPDLYYHAYPLSWWSRFRDVCDISYVPWEIIGSRPARVLLRGERVARAFYAMAMKMEATMPKVASRLWQYSIMVLDKRA
jgi:SAM-dependent methyltransferase